MSIARKAVLIISIPLLFEIALLVSYFESERRSADHRARQARSTETALSAGRLLGLTNDAQSILRAYALTHDPALLNVFRRSVEKLPQELQVFQRLAPRALEK